MSVLIRMENREKFMKKLRSLCNRYMCEVGVIDCLQSMIDQIEGEDE